MKKIFAIMLALAMLLCTAAMAEGTKTFDNKNASFEITYTVNANYAYSVIVPDMVTATGYCGGESTEFVCTLQNDATFQEKFNLNMDNSSLIDGNGNTMTMTINNLPENDTIDAGKSHNYTIKLQFGEVNIQKLTSNTAFTGSLVFEVELVK